LAPHRDSFSGNPNFWLPLLAKDPDRCVGCIPSADVPLKTALGIGVGDSLEALLGACLLQQVARFQPALDRLWDVLGFVALAALFATTLGAMMGVASLWWGEVLDPSQGIPIWWHGRHFGSVSVEPR
jgi:integral membrane sensor domain MASE1